MNFINPVTLTANLTFSLSALWAKFVTMLKSLFFFLSLFILSFFLSPGSASGQQKIISGILKDNHSEEPVPFSSIQFKNSTVGKLSDSAGRFSFILTHWPSDTLEITNVSYQQVLYIIDKSKDSIFITVMLEPRKINDNATVKIKINKGLYLWRKIVEHKPQNDKFRFDNFSYELYNKLELDLKNFSTAKISKFKPLRPVTNIINQNIDSSDGVKYLPAYLTESISDYYYQKKPLRRREIIKAANTNGIKNESMLKYLGGTDQNVNVYNNFIPVFDKQFVSPASDNGDKYYNYSVTDTQYIGKKAYFHLVFAPKRKGENTFDGDCWVQAATFGIQKMNLRLEKDANVNFLERLSMIQEYQLLNDTTWFLLKDKFVADVSPIGDERLGFIGRKTTTYQDIVVNNSSVIKELDKNTIQEEIITLPGAAEKSKEFWDTARHEELTENEKGIIHMIDTLTNSPHFQKFTKTLAFIGTGYFNVGNYQLGPWYYWVSSNGWEGFRLRFDLATNRHFDKKIWLHGYLAYGFGDKAFKGKAEAFYLPKKNPRTFLYGSYTDDLDFGQTYYGEITSDNIFSLAIHKPGIPRKFIRINEKRFEFYHQRKNGLSGFFIFSHKIFYPLMGLPGKEQYVTPTDPDPLRTFEATFRLRFAYLEKYLENTFFRTSLGSPYPVAELYFTRGIQGIFKSGYSYSKVFANVSDNFKISPFGTISYFVFAGKTFGTLPYVLLDIAPGNDLYYYNKYAFSMMNRWEFLHDRYAGLTFEHNFGSGIFKWFGPTRKMKLRQFWTVKLLNADLSDENTALNFKAGHNFQTLDGKTYMEFGTGIDNILRVLRIDFIWRLLPTPLPPQRIRRFGVYGSVRIGF